MSETSTHAKSYGNSKIDPSFKSKRYRDKLRTEIKALEVLIPIDRSALHRKLDSQTVFRLCISFFRLKILFKALGLNKNTTDEHDGKPEMTETPCGNPETLFSGLNCYQILDGFLMVATTDGTILYTSDNVLQYLGFNQVDLMHRCMYGVVHPEDHYDLKYVLEHSMRILPSQRPLTEETSEQTTSERPVEFICRMKCFNGTTAGYLKVHCSGRITRTPDLTIKTNTNLLQVLLLFCQPFMLTGNDFTHDVKQNVFWSKHDMDLTIRELDKKTKELVGYETEELNDQSFYSIIHPEDLATFATCHKTLMESTDVQTVYFRLLSKSGVWTWVHSRGKVISKNSKKFSIVFTHCPVREEDSTFLQQETNLRRRYAIQDLLYFIQYGNYSNYLHKPDNTSDDVNGFNKTGDLSTPYLGFTEDVSMSFYSPMTSCPSSWHAMSDRHSPVLPSTHVAHKITQREKQVQFQEFRRRQRYEKQQNSRSKYFGCNSFTVPENGAPMPVPYNESCHYDPSSKQIKLEPVDNSYNAPCYQQLPTADIRFANASQYYHGSPAHQSFHQAAPVYQPPPPYPYHYQYHTRFNLPPSPPISPHFIPQHELDARGVAYLPNQPPSLNQSVRMQTPPQLHMANALLAHFPQRQDGSGNRWQNVTDDTNNSYRSQANLRVSMHCDYSDTSNYSNGPDNMFNTSQNHLLPMNYFHLGHIPHPNCAISNNTRKDNVVKYDIEASIHMKIVENPSCRGTSVKQEVDLPSIGSFLEYLNEN